MSEQAQVGDTVRLTITRTFEGVVDYAYNKFFVDGMDINGPFRAYEILSRATPPLPSEPGTWWLDKWNSVWHVDNYGVLLCICNDDVYPNYVGPFRQLVLK